MCVLKVFAIVFISVANLFPVYGQNIAFLSKLTADIIENERVAAILYARTCWSKTDSSAFVQSMSIPIQIVDSNAPIDLPYDDNTNKQWFFVDMNCMEYPTFLKSVDEKYFAHPYRWILIDAANDTIEHLNFLPNSNIILANFDRISEQFILKQGRIMLSLSPVFHLYKRKFCIFFPKNSVQN